MKTATEILDAYERLGWKNNDPMAQMLQLRRDAPAALADLVLQALDRPIKHATVIDAALDLMDDAAYVATVGEVWRRGADSELARAVLDSAAVQHPEAFARDWERLLTAVQDDDGGPEYAADLAWRALDDATLLDWLHRLDDDLAEGSPGRARAVALLRSRRPQTVYAAWRRLFPEADAPDAASWLQQAGYAEHGGGLRALHGEQPLHIGFSAAQRKSMLAQQPAWRREMQRAHPTWNPESTDRAQARMGGTSANRCGLCHGPLHRLLAIQDAAAAGIDNHSAIEFATCLSCQGWETDGALFFRHAEDGAPLMHPSQQRDAPLKPDFVASPLLEAGVTLFKAPARWHWQDWGESNGRQNLSRVGGAPSWVQSADYPACADCGEDMPLAMQLDSGLPQEDGGEWLWGSGGCNYTFWCAACRVSGHLWQCT
ncbi:serine/threonine-protein kinase [Achromobacter animicus]|uniref:hypothetical protein n=1 Tax=Achromobacter animicus TaxID=1389935 RepID=UPI0014688C90|nr:hypothetical protein [Achromobacter animicus]CAB3844876.1 hypothetical protein LMG26691_01671 [Achromobacter animicus]